MGRDLETGTLGDWYSYVESDDEREVGMNNNLCIVNNSVMHNINTWRMMM